MFQPFINWVTFTQLSIMFSQCNTKIIAYIYFQHTGQEKNQTVTITAHIKNLIRVYIFNHSSSSWNCTVILKYVLKGELSFPGKMEENLKAPEKANIKICKVRMQIKRIHC